VEEVIFERKSPVVMLTMSSSTVPKLADTACIKASSRGLLTPRWVTAEFYTGERLRL
jgi:hypothetical protein